MTLLSLLMPQHQKRSSITSILQCMILHVYHDRSIIWLLMQLYVCIRQPWKWYHTIELPGNGGDGKLSTLAALTHQRWYLAAIKQHWGEGKCLPQNFLSLPSSQAKMLSLGLRCSVHARPRASTKAAGHRPRFSTKASSERCCECEGWGRACGVEGPLDSERCTGGSRTRGRGASTSPLAGGPPIHHAWPCGGHVRLPARVTEPTKL
jgi:hypothetical protein